MPPRGAEVVNKARDLLRDRLKELDQERTHLERALAELSGNRRASGRPRRGTRRRGSGTRTKDALKLVKENPGITAGEIAKKLGIAPNYIYRIMGDLQKQGSVKKSGRSYEAT